MSAASEIIYLDNNSSTRIDPAVLEEMMPFLTTQYGNPSGSHRFGTKVKEATDLAHERVASLLGCEPNEIVFTSGGTESDNTAIHSALQMSPERRHLVTTSVEHNAVLNYCEAVVRRGCAVTVVEVNEQGHLDLGELERAIRPDTACVSVMWANNETGVIFPLVEIADLCRSKGVFFHTDAVQAVGKMPINLSGLPIHFLSLSGHKLHAPKGVGALYVNRKARFQPLLVGGPQEGGRRAGTDNVPSIVGLGKAAELALETLEEENTRVRALRDRFESTLLATGRGSGKRRSRGAFAQHFESRLHRGRRAGDFDEARSGRNLLFVRLFLHHRGGAAFARLARIAFLERTGAQQPPIFVRSLQHRGRAGPGA